MNFTEILADIDFLLGTDTTGYSVADKTRNVNSRLDEVVSLILQYDYNWKWDDSNQVDLPIGTTNLINGQQDYGIAGSQFIKVTGVKVKDTSGVYQTLTRLTQNEVIDKYPGFETNTGLPKYFTELDDSILLYPIPTTSTVTLTAGLKVYYQRLPSYFITSDTTKSPGFNPLYHKLLSYGAAIDYASANNMSQKINTLVPLFQTMQQQLCIAYTRRPAEQRPRMTPKFESTR